MSAPSVTGESPAGETSDLDPVEVARRIVTEADPEGTLPPCGMRSVRIGSLDW